MRNDLAITAACRAGGPDRKESLTSRDLTDTVAMPAGFRFGAFFATIAATVGTNFPLLDFDFGFSSRNRFHKIQTQIISQISAGHRPAPRLPPGGETEKILKNISKALKNILKAAESVKTGIFEPGRAVLIIEGTLLRIPQNLVSFSSFFEFFFS
jgi:hypothetical protein